MTYFDSHYVSNSDIKELRYRIDRKFDKPDNIEEIFDSGTLNHHALFEPYKADKNHKSYALACQMASTVLKDDMLKNIIMLPDFRREHEWYRKGVFGLDCRCKTDGDSKSMSLVIDYKGLAISSDKAFEESIDRFDYDQAIAWYLDIVKYDNYLLFGVSKIKPNLIFKRFVTREHEYYQRGLEKAENGVKLWKAIIPDTIEIN